MYRYQCTNDGCTVGVMSDVIFDEEDVPVCLHVEPIPDAVRPAVTNRVVEWAMARDEDGDT